MMIQIQQFQMAKAIGMFEKMLCTFVGKRTAGECQHFQLRQNVAFQHAADDFVLLFAVHQTKMRQAWEEDFDASFITISSDASKP